jgi:glycosyltransferase involved in cell wall biosynthesis
MKVTIIIPVYNVAPHIIRCLRSVVAQTYHNIECILIDDCGTDNSIQLTEQFINQYNGAIHFTIVRHQQNIGPSAARNTGLKNATGEYIYFMDSDDTITPDCIEILTNLAKKYPDADYIQGNIITGTEVLNEGHIDSDVPEFCDNKRQLENIILCKTHRTAWNKLIKRTFLTKNSLLFPVGLIMEDHYWTYFISKQIHAAVFCHKGTYYYYKNKDSIINSPSKTSLIKRYSSYIIISDIIINDLLLRNDIQPCHSRYIGETIVFSMINLARLHSLHHWCVFWKYAFQTAYKLRTRFTWRRFCLFICMMPPFCFMTSIRGWRWRIRHYIIAKI